MSDPGRVDVAVLLTHMDEVARAAGRAILEVYRGAFEVELKADRTPVTRADLRAHDVVRDGLEGLAELTGGALPLVSEEQEQVPFAVRRSWEAHWLVDPLDGTREFVKRNGEFTVNVALVQGDVSVAGVVHAPALDLSYGGGVGAGAWRRRGDGEREPIRVAPPRDRELVVLLSRSHAGPETHAFVDELRRDHDVRIGTRGSALKACMVAEGAAHLYPRFGPTSEWDTAASQAIVEAAGGVLGAIGSGSPLRYGSRELRNPPFYVGYGPEAPHP